MKRLFTAGLCAMLSITPAFQALAEEKSDSPLADAPTQYSADLVISRKVGTPLTMRLYVDGNKRRTEQETKGGTVIILRGDLSKQYTLIAASKTYAERALDPNLLESPTDSAKRLGIVHEKVGTENLNGELCDKYQYSTDPTKMPNVQNPLNRPRINRPVSGFIWVSQSTHMLVKSENPASTAEWKNIKLGPPDASLFEVPTDYKKLEPGKPPEFKPSEPKSTGESSPGEKSDGDK